jgi:hypothetical protein
MGFGRRSFSYQGETHDVSVVDAQRERVYRAERLVAFPDLGLQSGDREGTKRLFARVARSSCFRRLVERWTKPGHLSPPTLRFGHGSRRSSEAAGSLVVLAPCHVGVAWVVLHELAHAASPRQVSHHWPFCAAYLELVRRFMGAETARELRSKMRETKARWKPRRRRAMTDEQRAAFRSRMAALRAAKETT